MDPSLNDLLGDPIFQLNAILWLAQPLHEGSPIIPLFYQQGFSVYAIAPPLGIPPDVRLVAQTAQIDLQDRVRPDVVLTNERNQSYVFTECKKNSFGPTSSTAHQARGLLVLAGPRSHEILGLGPGQVSSSLLGFVAPEAVGQSLANTLEVLNKELDGAAIPAGRYSVLGISLNANAISLAVDQTGGAFFNLTPGTHPFMQRHPDTDPRPLYFIPFDPDVEQSKEERSLCKRILFERMHSSVLAAVGRIDPPRELLLQSQRILNDATFGMYEHWENKDSARFMRRLCNQFLDSIAKAVNTLSPGAMTFQHQVGWQLSLPDQARHEKVIDALTRFSSETLDLRTDPLPGFFDDL
jgi:hypothetical protein